MSAGRCQFGLCRQDAELSVRPRPEIDPPVQVCCPHLRFVLRWGVVLDGVPEISYIGPTASSPGVVVIDDEWPDVGAA